MRPTYGGGRGQQGGDSRAGASAIAASKQLNQQIIQAGSLQELVHVLLVNFGRLSAINYCTAFHRLAKHVEDGRRARSPPESWPPAQQQQLGGVLSQLNVALVEQLGEVQAHNLGLTLWSISKLHQLPQQGSQELVAALLAEITQRLSGATQDAYLRDKHLNFGAQALSNIVYSLASLGLRPDYDLLHAVAKGVAWQVDEFKPQGVANILWALGKLNVKLTHEVRQMVEILGREMTAQLTHARHKGSVAPQNISNTLHGLTNLGAVPAPELLSALVASAGSMLRQFGPQELTNTVWSLSQMARNGVHLTPDVEALLDRIPDELLLLFGDRAWRARVRPQTISNLAIAYAHLQRQPQMLMMELVSEAQPLLGQFKPQELSNLLWALATMSFYPGAAPVDAITRTAGAAADRMKPQEIANCCWAWATMRHFPGPAIMDAMLAAAECQLDLFKSQELGMMCWAAARLAYMPAVQLVRAALPYLSAQRATAVQDCGNMLWALTVLDILTPEALRMLCDRLLAFPREAYTQEIFLQVFQSKLGMSHQVYDVAQYIPAELLAQGELEWRKQSMEHRVSVTHRDVANVMRELGLDFEVEKKIEDGLMSVDIALRGEMVAVEVDGSAHFAMNEPFVPLGRTIWRWRMLASRGWRVVTVPYFRWATLASLAQKKQYLYVLLQCQSVWDCFALDPADRDAPFRPPANLAHLSPDEVFHLAEQGISPSSLLAAPGGSAPSLSPATPLLAGLGPAAGGSSAQPAGMLPLQMSPPGGAAGSAAARLPDNLYAGEEAAAGAGSSGSSPALRHGSALNVGARPFSFGGGSASSSFGSSTGHGAGTYYGASAASGGHTYGASLSGKADGGSHFGAGRGSALAPSAPAFSPRGLLATHTSSPATNRSSAPSSVPGSSNASPLVLAGSALKAATPQGLPGLKSASSAASSVTQVETIWPGSPSLGQQGLGQLPPGLGRAGSSGANSAVGGRAGSTEAASGLAAPAAVGQQLQGLNLQDDSDDDVGDLRSYFGSVIGQQPAQGPQQPRGPLSVEEVRRKLALLPADVAVADVAPAWLSDWDSDRAVELLQGLHSPALSARALQLFEWLRSLGPDSPLAHLCTPGAYAAMIGLFGQWRKPKQAVRLFAELKERGEDGAEVHSALVEAFCRSGEAQVALDAYRNLLSQGLLPTSGATRAVLDALMQQGAWEEADAVLAGLVDRAEELGEGGGGEAADAELFDWVIARASASNCPSAAQSAFERMCQAGAAPTPATFEALLGTLRRQHPPEEVAQLAMGLAEQADAAAAMAALAATGAAPAALESAAAGRPPALHALHEACRLRGWWDLGLRLLAAEEEAGRQPSPESVNAVLGACAAAGAVQEARQTFDRLAAYGLAPTADSYLLLVAAHANAGLWAEAAQHYEAALAAGVTPSAELASLVVDALWSSGLPWAQAAAMEAHSQAISAGWLPPAEAIGTRGLLRVELNALHVGTGVLSVHSWLHTLRASIGNSTGPCILDENKRVCIVNTADSLDASAAGSLASGIKAGAGASLVRHKCPFRVSWEGGRAVRLESSTFMLKRWLFTDAFEEWKRAFPARAAASSGAPGQGLSPAVLEEEAASREKSAQAFAAIRAYEAAHPPSPDAPGLAPSGGYCGQRRRDLLEGARHLAAAVGLGGEAQLWHAAVVLLDRLAAAGHRPAMDAALAAAVLSLAAQQEGLPLDLTVLAALLDREVTARATGLEPEDALAGEVEAVTATLQGDTACPSAAHCWRAFAERLQCDASDAAQVSALLADSLERLGRLAAEEERFWLRYPPSVQAAAALCIARKERGVLPFWPAALQHLTGYSEEQHSQFSEALRDLHKTSPYGSSVTQAVFS